MLLLPFPPNLVCFPKYRAPEGQAGVSLRLRPTHRCSCCCLYYSLDIADVQYGKAEPAEPKQSFYLDVGVASDLI